MKFRSPTDSTLRVALLSGHVAMVGPDWRELDPIFHREAMALGAQVDQARFDNPDVLPESGDDAPSQTDEDADIRAALIKMLGRDEDGDFVGSTGLPNVKAVERVCGFRTSKEAVHRVFRALKNEAESGAD